MKDVFLPLRYRAEDDDNNNNEGKETAAFSVHISLKRIKAAGGGFQVSLKRSLFLVRLFYESRTLL